MKKQEKRKKVAIITGASSGIGLASARLFVKNGFKVYGIARGIFSYPEFACLNCDVNDAEKMQKIMEDILSNEGFIDVFVNCAGFGMAGELVNSDLKTLQSLFSTNLTAVAVNTAMVGKIMKKQGFGKIINISSLASIFPVPYQAGYSATKVGVDVISRTARTELKPYGVYVSLVVPGDVNTGFTAARVKSQNENDKVSRSVARMEGYERKGMTPEKIAKVIYKSAVCKKPRVRVCVGALKLLIPLQKFLPVSWLDFLIRVIYC